MDPIHVLLHSCPGLVLLSARRAEEHLLLVNPLHVTSKREGRHFFAADAALGQVISRRVGLALVLVHSEHLHPADATFGALSMDSGQMPVHCGSEDEAWPTRGNALNGRFCAD